MTEDWREIVETTYRNHIGKLQEKWSADLAKGVAGNNALLKMLTERGLWFWDETEQPNLGESHD